MSSSLAKIPPLLEKSAIVAALEDESPAIDVDTLFDEIMEKSQINTTVFAVENILSPVFNSSRNTLWYFLENKNVFFSPSLGKTVPISSPLLYECFKKKTIILVQSEKRLEMEEMYMNQNNLIDNGASKSDDNIMLIPFAPRNGNVGAIVELAVSKNNDFILPQHKAARSLMMKFRFYYNFLISDAPINTEVKELLMSSKLPEAYESVSSSLMRFFNAKKVEFWMYKDSDNTLIKIDQPDENPTNIEISKAGIALYCISRNVVINERYAKSNKYYLESIDGVGDDPVVCVPFSMKDNKRWALVLRGRVSPPYFNKVDEAQLIALAPFAIKTIAAANLPPSESSQFDDFEKRLETLLDIAEVLSGELDIDKLIPTIMSRACSLLNAQRCSLFLVEKQTDMLVTQFADGVDRAIKIPMSNGIVGTTATTGEILNIADAYRDKRFDKSIDVSTGFKTVSILSVPIYNNRGEITGVTEMINKKGNKTFDDDDTRMMMAFNVFCGISLDNAKLVKASLDLSKQLTTFTEMSSKFETEDSAEVLHELLVNAKNIIGATSAILYKFNTDDKSFQLLFQAGKDSQYGTQFAEICVNERTEKLFTSDEIDEILFPTKHELKGTKLGHEDVIDSILSSVRSRISARQSISSITSNGDKRLSTVLSSTGKISIEQPPECESICCLPLTNNEEAILGVMQFSCPWMIIHEDIKMLKSFVSFASLILERKDLKSISEHGQDEVELDIWMTKEERKMMDKIPAKFHIPEDVLKNNVFAICFNSLEWDGIGHFKVLFNIFNYFEFFSIFKVTNEKFFRFLFQVRSMYKHVPYHNWRHAVDVTQFVSYEIMISGLEKVFTKFELFAIIVACICHDVNHDGFTNVYNVKAETPLGILYKNQSVMETHHCSIAIQILSREDCNLLEALTPEEYITIWNLIIQFILATDMARHFEIIKKFNDIYDGGDFTMQRSDHRIMLLQMVLKCGDISNVSRPFDLANRWCDVLCEEFFRQGDLEAAQGMQYTSENNDREHLNKPKSQIGFYSFICLPMFQAAGKAVPALDANMKQVQSNLAVWKRKREEEEEKEKEAMALSQPEQKQGEKEETKEKPKQEEKPADATRESSIAPPTENTDKVVIKEQESNEKDEKENNN